MNGDFLSEDVVPEMMETNSKVLGPWSEFWLAFDLDARYIIFEDLTMYGRLSDGNRNVSTLGFLEEVHHGDDLA